MNKYIKERIYKEANHILKKESTIRETAKKFKVSKSTVHKDLKENLKKLDSNLYIKIEKILKKHKEIRHLKGGEATRIKYQKLKEG